MVAPPPQVILPHALTHDSVDQDKGPLSFGRGVSEMVRLGKHFHHVLLEGPYHHRSFPPAAPASGLVPVALQPLQHLELC